MGRRAATAIRHLQQKRTDPLESAGSRENDHAPLQTGDRVKRRLADTACDLRVEIRELLRAAARIANDESRRDDSLDTEDSGSLCPESKQITGQQEIYDVPGPVR